MSYILDALKRADAERERGAVPGLHSQTAAPMASTPKSPSSGRWPLLAAVGLCALVLLAAALWWFSRADTPLPARVLAPATAPVVPQTPTPAPIPAPRPDAPAEAPVTPTPATPATPAAVPPLLRPEPPVAAMTTTQNTPSGATATVSHAQPAPTTSRNTEASDAGVRRFADLSPEQRAQLPQLSVSGASYSANPAHRMLIVNGAVAQEGQEVAPGLVLERIGLHQAVLRQGNLRFSIAY